MATPKLEDGLIVEQSFRIVPEDDLADDTLTAIDVDHAGFAAGGDIVAHGDFLLHDVRRDSAGAPKPDFPLNDPAYAKAAIIVAARNFGTGSSREAAVYALWDAGIRTVIAPSFGDIFASNAVKNGLLPARVSPEDQARLIADLAADLGIVDTVHLAQQEILWRDETIGFDIAEGAKQQLLNGWDDIDMTMQHGASIEAWSTADKARRPWAVPRLSATP